MDRTPSSPSCVSKEGTVATSATSSHGSEGGNFGNSHENPAASAANAKKLDVLSALFGECLALQCADFNQFRSDGTTTAATPANTSPFDHSSSGGGGLGTTPKTQFVKLDGIECIALGAVEKELSAKGRVDDTIDMLVSRTDRVISVGYLVEGEADLELAKKTKGTKDADPILRASPSMAASDFSDDLARLGVDIAAEQRKMKEEMDAHQQEKQKEEEEVAEEEEAPFFSRVSVSLPLEVYEKNYPGDLEQSMHRHARAAVAHLKKNEFKRAYHCFHKMLVHQKRHINYDDNTYLIGMTMHNMGVVRLLDRDNDYPIGGDHDDAGDGNEEKQQDTMTLFQQAVEQKKATFGPDHPEVAVSLDEIGIQLFAKERYKDALAAFQEAKRIRVRALGPDHPKVAMVLNNMACVYFQMKNPVAALTTFQEARDIQQVALGSLAKADLDLLHVATTLCNFGYMKLRLKNYDDALAIFEEALLVQQSVLGENNETIKDTLSNMDFANAFHS